MKLSWKHVSLILDVVAAMTVMVLTGHEDAAGTLAVIAGTVGVLVMVLG